MGKIPRPAWETGASSERPTDNDLWLWFHEGDHAAGSRVDAWVNAVDPALGWRQARDHIERLDLVMELALDFQRAASWCKGHPQLHGSVHVWLWACRCYRDGLLGEEQP